MEPCEETRLLSLPRDLTARSLDQHCSKDVVHIALFRSKVTPTFKLPYDNGENNFPCYKNQNKFQEWKTSHLYGGTRLC